MSFVAKVKTESDGNVTLSAIGSTLYGVCPTPATTAAKEVNVGLATLTNMGGITIHVKFQYKNDVANPTLNVDGTGPLPIYRHSTNGAGKAIYDSWDAGSVLSFTYDATVDGECWRMNDSGANAAIISKAHDEVTTEAATRAANDTAVVTQIAETYDNTATYPLGALSIHDDKLYECTTPITTAEEWTPGHWSAAKVSAKLGKTFRFTDTQIGIASTATADIGESTGITAATVDVNTFENIISTTGEYEFVYVNTDWTYNSNVITLTNYGISVTGTEANGDTVTITYTAGVAPFKQNATYAAFPYRATLPLAGVTETMVVEVIFGCEDAILGMFAPIVESYDGGIYIYATNVPTSPVTIPTIVARG